MSCNLWQELSGILCGSLWTVKYDALVIGLVSTLGAAVMDVEEVTRHVDLHSGEAEAQEAFKRGVLASRSRDGHSWNRSFQITLT